MNVEVDAAPQEDMSVTLAAMREHYEAVASKNRKTLEAWFQAKVGPPSLDQYSIRLEMDMILYLFVVVFIFSQRS